MTAVESGLAHRADADRSGVVQLLALCGALYAAFAAYLFGVLEFNPLVSDALGYWTESLDWRRPFSAWWVPGYPLTLALVAGATAHRLPPAAVMILTSSVFYLVGVAAARALTRELHVPPRAADAAALLVAVYPFVGLSYAAYPIADAMASALVLLMMLALARQRWRWFALAVAACLLTHKAAWYFVLSAVALAWTRHRASRVWCVVGAIPLAAFALAGALYHGDLLWMVRWSATHLLVSRSGWPLFDGLAGSLITGEPAKLARGVVVLAVLAVATWVFVASWRARLWVGVAVAVPILAMGVTLNQYEIWALVRFSKPLVVPAVACAMPIVAALPLRAGLACAAALVASGVLTNAGYSLYLTRFFASRI